VNALLSRVIASAALALALAVQAKESNETSHPPEQGPQVVAMDADPALRQPLIDAFEAMGEEYVPRTEYLLADGSPKYINRLILEDSPYLHQHAHNPVNWYPWGEEAFAVSCDGA